MSENSTGEGVFALILVLGGMVGGMCMGVRSCESHPCREERLSATGLREACASAEARLEERDGGAVWCRCPETTGRSLKKFEKE